MVEVTVTIDFGPAGKPRVEKTIILADKSTVFDALSGVVVAVTSEKFGMDHFVEEIDGIKNNFASNCGWYFEVNGYRSNIPAERYLVRNGDWIKWLYLAASCAAHR
jgi:Domain of unknown function (DUF4430)